jgi:lysozyme
VPLNDNQFAALVSFVFNVGETAFAKSSLLKKLNAGDHAAVPKELMRWVKAAGIQMDGLVRRRLAESDLWTRKDK